MKIGRNGPCPCGSGKKYKMCCIFKKDDELITNNYDDSTESILSEETFINAINGLRQLMLKSKPHIKKYLKIRKLHTEIAQSMYNYFAEGKFKLEIDPNFQSDNNKQPVINEFIINTNTEIGESVYYELLIYKCAPNIKCITEVFLQKRKFRKLEKVNLMNSMLNADLGLYEVLSVNADEGMVNVRNIFTDKEYKVTDIALSGNTHYDDYYYYIRILSYDDVNFNSGINLIFKKSDEFIIDFIKRNKETYKHVYEFGRFLELYNEYSSNSKGLKVITNSLK